MGPLSGLSVVEFAGLGPCPLAGQLLADLGANVISIERRAIDDNPADINRRNKRSIAINLKSEAGLGIAKQLLQSADVLIEGFRPGVMEKLGLGPEPVQTINPTLVYGRVTGWGQTGNLAQTAGHDINYLSLTGALHAMGEKDRLPMPPLNLIADYGGGTLFLLFGVLAALLERQSSGKGQVVDAAMIDGVSAMLPLIQQWRAQGDWNAQRESNLLDGGAPFYCCYATADDKSVAVGPLEPKFYAQFLRKLELDSVSENSQYIKSEWPTLRQLFANRFKQKSQAYWIEHFDHSDCCVTPVLSFDDAPQHEHHRSRDSFVTINDITQCAPVPRFSRTITDKPKAPVGTDTHSKAILKELGFTQNQITELFSEGVLMQSAIAE